MAPNIEQVKVFVQQIMAMGGDKDKIDSETEYEKLSELSQKLSNSGCTHGLTYIKGLMVEYETAKGTETKPTYNYTLGPRKGNVRIVGSDSISMPQATNSNAAYTLSNIAGLINTRQNANHVANTNDGVFNSSAQGRRGDCYLLAEINAIRNTKAGQAVLKNNIKYNSDKSITVTLPGAVKIRQQYAKEGKKCEVTGTYRITQDALKKAAGLAGQSYSKGDLDVIALEIAVENFRAEMVKTNKLNGNQNQGGLTAESAVSHVSNGSDYLYGGQTYDAGFLLTGNKSAVYHSNTQKYDNVTPYKTGQYGYITRAEMMSETTSTENTKSVSEVSRYTQKEGELNKMLDQYSGHENDYALTFSVRVAEDGPDGFTKAGNGHALTVVKITQDTVYVANPWFPDKIEPIPRDKFLKMTTGFTATPVGTPSNASSTSISPQDMTNQVLELLKNGGLNRAGSSSKTDPPKFSHVLNDPPHTVSLTYEEKQRLSNLLNNL